MDNYELSFVLLCQAKL